MAIINPITLIGRAISRGKSPKIASALTVPLDFSLASEYTLDFDVQSGIRNVTGIDGIQSVHIDNSNNGAILIIVFAETGQTITAPSYSMGIYPVFYSGNRLTFKASTSGNVLCKLIFLNTREQAQVWSTFTSLSGTINVSGSSIQVAPVGAVAVDHSVVLPANASTLVMPANANRKRFIIQNRSSAAGQGGIAGAENAYFNVGGVAALDGAGSFELPPGASYDTSGGVSMTDAIYAIAATAGHYIIAKEFV